MSDVDPIELAKTIREEQREVEQLFGAPPGSTTDILARAVLSLAAERDAFKATADNLLCHICKQPRDGYGSEQCSAVHTSRRLMGERDQLRAALREACDGWVADRVLDLGRIAELRKLAGG